MCVYGCSSGIIILRISGFKSLILHKYYLSIFELRLVYKCFPKCKIILKHFNTVRYVWIFLSKFKTWISKSIMKMTFETIIMQTSNYLFGNRKYYKAANKFRKELRELIREVLATCFLMNLRWILFKKRYLFCSWKGDIASRSFFILY